MTTELREAMTSGVLVEFHDAQDKLLGQAVYTDWRGRPVPAVGDMLASSVRTAGAAEPVSMRGRVVARHFQLQAEADGTPSVWVRLVVAVSPKNRTHAGAHGVHFSQN